MTDFKKNEKFGFFEIWSEVSGMVLVDRKVVSIGPDALVWCGLVWSGLVW